MAKRQFSIAQHILNIVQAIVLLPTIFLTAFLCPYNKIYKLCYRIGKVFFFLSPSKKKIIIENLKIITPDKVYSQNEINQIGAVLSGYELRILLEMIKFSTMGIQEFLSYIRIQNPQTLSQAYHMQQINQGLVACTMHSGNWELFAMLLSKINIQMVSLMERQFNPCIDMLIVYLRKKSGVVTLYNEISAMRPMFQLIRKGAIIGLVADQTYWFDPLFIPFFNKEAAVPQGVASLALRMKTPIFTGYSFYQENGIYSLQLEPIIPIVPSSNRQDDIYSIMTIIYKQYEEKILLDPKNWCTLSFPRWDLTREKLKIWEQNPDSSRF